MLDGFFINLPQLETERLLLRKLEYTDKQDIFEYASNPEVSKYMPWEAHGGEIDTLDFLNITYENYNNDRPASWGIVLKSINKIIGTAGFASLDKINLRAEFGYAISQDYWNKGIATEASKEILKYGFNQMGLNRIEAMCNVENIASARVLEKAGLTLEGILREYILVKEKFVDHKLYSILKVHY